MSIFQSFNVDLLFYQYWTDKRLILPPNTTSITLTDNWKYFLWMPNTFFWNAISGSIENIISPSIFFKINERKEVLMGARLHMRMFCSMNFTKFPFDEQICKMQISSRK